MNPDLFTGPQLAADSPRGLGRIMAGDGDKTKRHALDFYPTPAEATRALLRAEMPFLADRVGVEPGFWEPCGRGGAIARVAADEFGLSAIATDIVADPAHGVDQLDLFAAREALAPFVISNLPFAIARRMIAHLWGTLGVEYMALLFKATFLNCGESAALWRDGMGPNGRWDVTWRVDFKPAQRASRSPMDTCWLIWDRRNRDTFRYGLLTRDGPVPIGQGLF